MEEKTQTVELNASMIVDSLQCIESLTKGDNPKSIWLIADLLNKAITRNLPIYLTGIGKPGYVAQKCAATLKSIKVDGQFIDAILAGHGDLGAIPQDKQSLLIAMSKSGCSKELYGLFTALKQLRPKCIVMLICMSNDEQFKTVLDCKDIDLPVRFNVDPKEMDGFGIVPSTSNVLFEVILDTALSNAFSMEGLELKDMCKRLQQSHPSGTLYNKVSKLLEQLEQEEAIDPKAIADKAKQGKFKS